MNDISQYAQARAEGNLEKKAIDVLAGILERQELIQDKLKKEIEASQKIVKEASELADKDLLDFINTYDSVEPLKRRR